MSMPGKGGTQETSVKLDPAIEAAAKDNIDFSKLVSSLPFTPNFAPQVAAFSPTQDAAFRNTNDAASAFGLAPSSGIGLPKPETVGGISGYSTKNLYEDALSKMDPNVLQAIVSMFFPGGPQPAPVVTSGGGMRPTPAGYSSSGLTGSRPFK